MRLTWIRRWFVCGDAVSDLWLREQEVREGRAGWEGPRWRLPAERKVRARILRLIDARAERKEARRA